MRKYQLLGFSLLSLPLINNFLTNKPSFSDSSIEIKQKPVCTSVFDIDENSQDLMTCRLPNEHMPQPSHFSAEDLFIWSLQDPLFKTSIEQLGHTAEDFFKDETKEILGYTVLEATNHYVSAGTCDVQTYALCKLYLANPSLTMPELSDLLIQELPTLKQNKAKTLYIKYYGNYRNEFNMLKHGLGLNSKGADSSILAENLEKQFYGSDLHAAKNDNDDGYSEINLQLRSLLEEVETKLPQFLQIFQDLEAKNPQLRAFMGYLYCDTDNNSFRNIIPGGGHMFSLLKSDNNYMFYDSNFATFYQGSLDQVMPQMLLNFAKELHRYWKSINSKFSIDEWFKNIEMEIILKQLILNPKQYEEHERFTASQLSIANKTQTVLNEFKDSLSQEAPMRLKLRN